eukprot:TRINITY_DN7035_c0_g1_i1.p1 TRINITY_DN7035_c0_g1~~TRINITY_DN7035_c0_g1_i1.p1  ORF type:complete len:321 (-),score=84.25 TRINITY_DN7035_c0_g1_i1:43-1005(-)
MASPSPPNLDAHPPQHILAAKYRKHEEVLEHPLYQQLILGGVSSALSILITNPIDVVKCRLQLQHTSPNAEYKGMIRGGIHMVREEGVSSLYKGLEPALWRSFSYSAVRFGLYENFRDGLFGNLFGEKGAGSSASFTVKVLSGITAGSIAAAVGNPFELIKVRMQAKGTLPFNNTLQGIAHIAKSEGITGLWKGLIPNVGRSAMLTASQMAVYDQAKNSIKLHLKLEEGLSLHFLSAMLAGVVTTTITSPFDVVKTRVMQNPEAYGGGKTLQCFKDLIAQEGAMGVFKGWVPNYTRLGPQTLIIFMVYEQLRKLIGWNAL